MRRQQLDKKEMNAQSVALSVYIQGRTIIGTVSIPEGVRLTDFLNDRPKTRNAFLALSDVTIQYNEGGKETSKTVHINKNSIQMITTLGSDYRGIGAKDGSKQYPFIQKRPVRATIHLPGFKLIGYLYCAETREVTDLLAEEQPFLPCTDTIIYDVQRDSRWKTAFATINKSYISCFKED